MTNQTVRYGVKEVIEACWEPSDREHGVVLCGFVVQSVPFESALNECFERDIVVQSADSASFR